MAIKECEIWKDVKGYEGLYQINAENMKKLKAKYQIQIMDKYSMTEDDFIREFGKSYI